MPENNQEHRPVSARGKKFAVPALVTAAVLVTTYLAMCAYGSVSGKIMPNTFAAGVPLGGLTRAQAAERLSDAHAEQYDGKAVTFTCEGDESEDVTIPSHMISADLEDAARRAWQVGRQRGFFLQGFGLLAGLIGRHDIDVPLHFVSEGQINAIAARVAAAIDRQMGQTTYTVTDTSLILHKGEPGRLIDRQEMKESILKAFESGETHFEDAPAGHAAFTLVPSRVLPAEPDLDTLFHILYTEVKDAAFDPQTYQITPHAVGISFDVEAAREQYKRTDWGNDCEIPLNLTQPKLTTQQLEATLFRDVLGSCETQVGGSANRVSNVSLAASLCNEYIIVPGGVFSYNDTVGTRTSARGFLPAPAYVGNETVDEIGGGICQLSSTIYLAALRGNMKITERQHHRYAVGYIPDGMDATVYFGSLDFRFENNGDYPIKLVAGVKNRKLTVQLLGTKTDDITVKMESVRIDSTPYETIYQIDGSIVPGTSKESVSPYTGRKVEAYRCLYDGEGKLISRTLESVNNYKKRDRIILINSADAYKYGVDPVTGAPAPIVVPTPGPEPTPTPAEPDPGPEPTPTPAEPTPGVPVSPPPTEEPPSPAPTSDVSGDTPLLPPLPAPLPEEGE